MSRQAERGTATMDREEMQEGSVKGKRSSQGGRGRHNDEHDDNGNEPSGYGQVCR